MNAFFLSSVLGIQKIHASKFALYGIIYRIKIVSKFSLSFFDLPWVWCCHLIFKSNFSLHKNIFRLRFYWTKLRTLRVLRGQIRRESQKKKFFFSSLLMMHLLNCFMCIRNFSFKFDWKFSSKKIVKLTERLPKDRD